MTNDNLRQNRTQPPGSPALQVSQEKAIAALLAGATVTAAAAKAGVARQTVHRWLSDDPAFIAEYNLVRREMADSVGQSLRQLSVQSVKVLKRTMTSSKTPPGLKVQVAVAVLKIGAGPADGPTDIEDVKNMIAKRSRARLLAGALAHRGPT
jgi:hypothetical protein